MTEAGLRRLWVAAVIALVALIVVGSLTPGPVVPSRGFSDKVTHMFAYFALAMLGSGITTPSGLWRTMLRCFLLGAALEVAQALFTDHRVADLRDLAANASGIAAAWLVAGQGRAGWGMRAFARFSRQPPS